MANVIRFFGTADHINRDLRVYYRERMKAKFKDLL